MSETVCEILGEIECRLHELAIRSLEQRDYESAQQIAALADRVVKARGLVNKAGRDVDGEGTPSFEAKWNGVRVPASGAAKSLRREFPYFHRDDDHLVKTGMSKSDRRVYQHRCPRDVVDRVACELERLAAQEKAISLELLRPDKNENLSDVPVYQIYLAIAFLIKQGIVGRRGRSRYFIARGITSPLTKVVDREWDLLQRA